MNQIRLFRFLTAALAAGLAAAPIFAAGEEEGGGSAGAGAMMALEAAGGTPYVDYYWPTASAYTAATGNAIAAYGESPALAARVAAGELPAVADRLPADPAVIRPPFEIGQYGGRFRWHGVAVQNEPGMMIEGASQPLGKLAPDGGAIYPNVVADWSVSADRHTLTVNLRPGQKWSDGEDFDADDFVFWMDAVGTDDRVFSRARPRVTWQGKLPQLEVIDRYTVAFTWEDPFPIAQLVLLRDRPFYPEHYLAQFHADYNPQADAVAKEAGFESWTQAFRERSAERDGPGSRPTVMSANDIGMPSLDPWIIAEDGLDSELWARNPYYWRVDTAGNQLPYLDEVLVTFLSNAAEQLPVKVMAGELDLATGLSLADAPVLKRNEEDGNYVLTQYQNMTTATAAGWVFNYTHTDPGLNAIFNDVRFRQALSVAVDREDISDTLFFGQATPVLIPAPEAWTGFEPWMKQEYAQYDPELANRLLDEMGLQWDSERQWRLRPDNGEPVAFEGSWPAEWSAYFENLMDLISGYWEAVGIRMTPKFVPEELGFERAMANDIDSSFWPGGGASELIARQRYPMKLLPPWHWIHCCSATTAPWGIWYHSGGAEGERPDDPDVLRLFELADAMKLAEFGTAEYEAITNELLTLNARNLWHVATVTPEPLMLAVGNNLGNFLMDGILVLAWTYDNEVYYLKDR